MKFNMTMKTKQITHLFLVVILFFAFAGCGGTEEPDIEIPVDELQETEVKVSEEAINEIIESFSSPVEMAALISDLGVDFNRGYLADTDNAGDYDTNFKKALALGFFSADLGYLNVYEQNNLVINYITEIKRLSDDLKVGQFFDFQTLKRLAANNESIDSLMFLSVHSFHQMDQHMRSNKRSHLSALVVAGVWIEGLYLATQVAKLKPTQEITDRIGEQKILLNNMIKIIEAYSGNDKNFKSLLKDFQDLKSAYQDIKITVEIGEPESKVVDGRLVIIQNETSVVDMSEEQLQQIISVVEEVRNKLIAI